MALAIGAPLETEYPHREVVALAPGRGILGQLITTTVYGIMCLNVLPYLRVTGENLYDLEARRNDLYAKLLLPNGYFAEPPQLDQDRWYMAQRNAGIFPDEDQRQSKHHEPSPLYQRLAQVRRNRETYNGLRSAALKLYAARATRAEQITDRFLGKINGMLHTNLS